MALRPGTPAPPEEGKDVARPYEAKTRHVDSRIVNGHAASPGGNQARRLAADPRGPPVASGVTYTVAAGDDAVAASLSSPARVKQAIAVGATGKKDIHVTFSNWGTRLDLFAPGVSATSASHRSRTGAATSPGTTAAAAHATGTAAPHLADHPPATPAQVAETPAKGAVSGKVKDRFPGSEGRILLVGVP